MQLEIISMLIEKEGFEVIKAQNGSEAFNCVWRTMADPQ